MNISNFMTWFLSEFYRIGTTLLAKLDNITIAGNVTLMQFIITIAIIGVFINLVIVAPNLGVVNRALNSRDRKIRERNKK